MIIKGEFKSSSAYVQLTECKSFPVLLITAHGQHGKAELEAFPVKALDN